MAGSMKSIYFWDVALCSLVKVYRRFRDAYCSIIWAMTEAVRTSETSVYFNETVRRYIPEGCNFEEEHNNQFIMSKVVLVDSNLHRCNNWSRERGNAG
jgi:hypothetical protein